MKQILSILLVLCVVLGVIPGEARAGAIGEVHPEDNSIWDGSIADSYAGGSGTSKDPYQIATAAQLAKVAYDTNNAETPSSVSYKLLNDIYLNDISNVEMWATSAPANTWTPIGDNVHYFTGNFDGAGYVIYGTYIKNSADHQGIFGCIGNATIQNLGNKSSYISGNDYVGGIVGSWRGNSNTIISCYNAGSVIGNNGVGGITGLIKNDYSLQIKSCYNLGRIQGSIYVGGIVGNGTVVRIVYCYNVGAVSGISKVAGIAGEGAHIAMCWNLGAIDGNDSIGGILGNMHRTGGLIDSNVNNSFNAGTINATTWAGGVIGHTVAFSGLYHSDVYDCYNVGAINADGDKVAGIVGYPEHALVSNCYNAGICEFGETGEAGAVLNSGFSTRWQSGNNYFLTGCCGADYKNPWETSYVAELDSSVMRENSFVDTLNKGGSGWKADMEGVNSGYPILNGIDYEVYAGYIEEPSKENIFHWNTPFNGDRDPDWEYTYSYDESWFSKDSTEYQHDLVKMSLCIAMAAYGAYDETLGDKFTYTEKNIKALFSDLGFDNNTTKYHYPEPILDSVGYAIGSKNIVLDSGEDCSLVLVAVRGGGYGVEWGGNFRITGDDGQLADKAHMGFSLARDHVIGGIKRYFEQNAGTLSTNCKIWITGYSRAAATTNLVAKELDDGTVDLNGVSIGPEDIYAFCFECPADTTDEAGNDADDKYSNIISIANPVDFVTKVAMSKWGFSRYGRTLFLPYAEGMGELFAELFQSMYFSYKSIASHNNHNLKPQEITPMYGQAKILDIFMNHLSTVLISPRWYFMLQNQNAFMKLAADCLGGGNFDVGTFFAAMMGIEEIGIMYLTYPINIALVKELITSGRFESGHYPELCLAWLNSLSGDVKDFAEPTYREVFINCPVDVSVYNSSGQLVVQITNDIVQEIDGGVVAYIDDNEQKIIALPNSEEYTVELNATNDGSVTYTVTEYNIDSSSTEKVVSYYEIPVVNGDELTGIVENLDEASSPTYPLYFNDDSTPLVPSITQDDEAVIEYNVEVTASGNGEAYGSGTYVNGTFAKVIADAGKGEKFQGWYIEDSLVSTEDEYRFLVNRDITIVAKFGESPAIDTYVLAVVDGTGSGNYVPGAQISIMANAAPNGKEFDKWTTNNGGTFADASSSSTTFTMPAGDVTITATYKDASSTPPASNIYTIAFNPAGGTVTPATATTDATGTLATLPTPIRNGYTFGGWFTSPNKGELISTETIFTADTTIYAHWVQNEIPPEPAPEPAVTHYIHTPTTQGGTITVTKHTAAPGDWVNIYAAPNEGCQLEALTVTDQRGWPVVVREMGENAFSFTMPPARVTVNAVFSKTAEDGENDLYAPAIPDTLPGTSPSASGVVLNPSPMNFTDVSAADWFYNDVRYCWQRYLMTGISDTQFAPQNTTSRAMIWAVIARLAGRDTSGGSTWYERGQIWAKNKGITDGAAPLTDVTREQLVTMLWRFKGTPYIHTDNLGQFKDAAEVSDWAVQPIRWAVANGLLNGASGSLNPRSNATRAEAAAILTRFCQFAG